MAVYAHSSYDLITSSMTANNAPSPFVASAGNAYNASFAAWYAFNHASTDGYYFVAGADVDWLKVYLGGTSKRAISYTITYSHGFSSGDTMAPKVFKLYGSLNDSTWVELDSRTAQTGWGDDEMRSFTITSPGSYNYYKLDVTENNGGAYLVIAEFELIGAPPPVDVDITSTSESASTTEVYHSNPIKDSSNSTASTTITVGNVAKYPDALVEDSTSDSAALANLAFFGTGSDSTASTSAVDVVLSHISDTSGDIETTTQAAVFAGIGIVEADGSLTAVALTPLFAGAGLQDAAGVIDVETLQAQLVAAGIVDVLGDGAWTTEKALFDSEGLTDGMGTMQLVGEVCRFTNSGITDILGDIQVLGVPSTAAFEGIIDVLGVIQAVCQTPILVLTTAVADTNIVTFCVNLLKKGLVSKFTNYAFNSFAVINNVPLAVGSTGLYRLTGNTDNGTNIAATLTFPLNKFDVSNVKQVRAIKVLGRNTTNVTVEITNDAGDVWETTIESIGTAGRPGIFPFTTRGKYLQVKIKNTAGGSLLLDSIELYLMILGKA